MATPNAPNRTTIADPPAPSPRIAPHQAGQPDVVAENTPAAPRRAAFWQTVSFYIVIGVIECVGFAIAMAGVYVFRDTAASIPLLVAGVIIMILASSAWIVATHFMIVALIRELFTGGRKTV